MHISDGYDFQRGNDDVFAVRAHELRIARAHWERLSELARWASIVPTECLSIFLSFRIARTQAACMEGLRRLDDHKFMCYSKNPR